MGRPARRKAATVHGASALVKSLDMNVYDTFQLRRATVRYAEFLRRPDMSAGIYKLAVGATDTQQPHSEDEVYYVLAGSARLRSGDFDITVKTGDVLFVPANEAHTFHDIREELALLVVFGPAEGTRTQS